MGHNYISVLLSEAFQGDLPLPPTQDSQGCGQRSSSILLDGMVPVGRAPRPQQILIGDHGPWSDGWAQPTGNAPPSVRRWLPPSTRAGAGYAACWAGKPVTPSSVLSGVGPGSALKPNFLKVSEGKKMSLCNWNQVHIN